MDDTSPKVKLSPKAKKKVAEEPARTGPINDTPQGFSENRLLTKTELAAKLRVEPRTIDRHVASGRIPVLRLGQRMIRYDWDQVCARMQVNFPR